MRHKKLLLLTLLIALVSVPGWSQTTATIVGTITDSSGAVAPNVSITVVSTDTGLTRTTTSNQGGNYVLPLLPVGHYSITAEATGFKKKTITGVVAEVSQEPRVDIVLEVGAMTESV
ncbi:MAG: carboxypeptidase-like regulatory domain-containing protein, partial [Acidobacteriota bacterium]|nr:carboxypeptidase-like regulatory domain-containing protein [Acidobacteriota bacterium]